MADGAFYEQLELPDVGPVRVVERDVDGSTVRLALRMEFTGSLDAIGRRVLGDGDLAWVQEVSFDTAAHTGRLAISTDARTDRVHFDAAMRLRADGDETVRSIRGDLAVRVPLVGRVAERKVLPGLARRLDLEAASLAEWLARA
jgi:hypothetical protein